jgi:hypothetical protein
MLSNDYSVCEEQEDVTDQGKKNCRRIDTDVMVLGCC